MAATPSLILRAELDAWGIRPDHLARLVAAGVLVRLRRGVYVMGEEWDAARPEDRVMSRAMALAVVSKDPPVSSHHTAAALHALPLLSTDLHQVHVIAPDSRPGRASGVVRHRGELLPDEVVERRGLLCTSLVRTVADIARTATPELAIAVSDAALRAKCVARRGTYDTDAAAAFRQQAMATVRRSAHGQSRAATRIAFADGRAERAGESISRLRLAQLGFRRIDLQIPVAAPEAGRWYFVDFSFEDLDVLGEFDGRVKYDGALARLERSSDEIVFDEKRREDWIRGVTGKRIVRWGWADIATTATFAARLEAFGIHPPG